MNVIRWVGSKRHSAIRIVEKFNTLPELPKRYFEPMCGGMSVAILYDHPNTFVNDINYDLINLYHVLCDDDARAEMLELYCKFENNKEFYYQLRSTFNGMDRSFDVDNHLSVPAAAMFYYLVNFGFRGLSRYNRKGLINTSFGDVVSSPKDYLILQRPNLDSVINKIKKWVITCENYETATLDCGEGDLIYIDPPYGNNIPYINTFEDSDVSMLVARINKWSNKGAHVALSYDKPDIGEFLSKDFTMEEVKSKYCFSNKFVTEYLFTNF